MPRLHMSTGRSTRSARVCARWNNQFFGTAGESHPLTPSTPRVSVPSAGRLSLRGHQRVTAVARVMIVIALAGGPVATALQGQTPARSRASVARELALAEAERLAIVAIATSESVSRLPPENTLKSRVGHFVYAVTAYRLGADPEGLQVLKHLPRSEAEMTAFSSFVYEHLDSRPRLDNLFYLAAFSHVRSHPAFLHQVFGVLTQFDAPSERYDLSANDWFCDEAARLHHESPTEFDTALSREPRSRRRFLGVCAAYAGDADAVRGPNWDPIASPAGAPAEPLRPRH